MQWKSQWAWCARMANDRTAQQFCHGREENRWHGMSPCRTPLPMLTWLIQPGKQERRQNTQLPIRPASTAVWPVLTFLSSGHRNGRNLAPSSRRTGQGDRKTDHIHHRRRERDLLPAPADVHSIAKVERGLISKHVHCQLVSYSPELLIK